MSFTSLTGIDEKKYFQVVFFSFLAVQILSWAISSVSSTPILKGGPMVFLFMAVVLIITLYNIGRDFSSLNLKKDGIFIIFVFVSIIILFIILPKLVPQIFSASGLEVRNFLIKSGGNIFSYGGTGVV